MASDEHELLLCVLWIALFGHKPVKFGDEIMPETVDAMVLVKAKGFLDHLFEPFAEIVPFGVR